jgi:hypothetical protein
MSTKITKVISGLLDDAFKALLQRGAFPKVEYKEFPLGSSFMLFEYSTTRSYFAHLAHLLIIENLHNPDGVFTRKRNKAFLDDVVALLASITEADVDNHHTRFSTWMD